MINDYQKFEDFILDESFREYILGSSETSVSFWNNWIETHPEKQGEIRKARQILITLFNHHKIDIKVDKNQSLAELLAKIEYEEDLSENKIIKLPGWIKVAAVIMVSVGMGWLWNFAYDNFINKDTLTFNEIIVPIGEKSQIVLSDGTHVWINSGSRFKYPISFGKKSRQVYLSGEAFFDVTKQEKQTFVVTTHDASVRVLGTAFNVKSYPEDAKTQTTVVRGLVSVQRLNESEEVLIRPNQMAVIRNSAEEKATGTAELPGKLHVLKNVNTEAVTCWKNQLLVFADEPLEDMAMKMERWFNVDIVIEDSTLRQERYNGKFVHNETIYEVLEAIKQTTSIKYSVEKDKIIIDRK
jgi:ferric-dicitrate binding protein FerR (iron transport regulator)